jgi:hypothetical protein
MRIEKINKIKGERSIDNKIRDELQRLKIFDWESYPSDFGMNSAEFIILLKDLIYPLSNEKLKRVLFLEDEIKKGNISKIIPDFSFNIRNGYMYLHFLKLNDLQIFYDIIKEIDIID